MATIKDCLATIELVPQDLASCPTLRDEFALIKKRFHKTILVCHPDKGGDAVKFRQVRSAFEVLRELFVKETVPSFASSAGTFTQASFNSASTSFSGQPTPSWEYFQAASEEPVPGYRVELAKSGRSKCNKKKYCHRGDRNLPDEEQTNIEIGLGEVRIGMLDEQSGNYFRWVHLECWRVPSIIWLGLENIQGGEAEFEAALLAMNEVLFSGLTELSRDNRKAIVKITMDRANWAKKTAPKQPKKEPKEEEAAGGGAVQVRKAKVRRGADGMLIKPHAEISEEAKRGQVAASKSGGRERFVIPVPGKDGVAGCLKGSTVVMTGIFPEVGGGAGLDLGKAKVKAMVESFGGRVTSAVSGRTNYLISGKDPGFSKVTKARNSGAELVSLQQMASFMRGEKSLEAAVQDEPLQIQSFSQGYSRFGGYNGLAQYASPAQLAYAAGTAPRHITDSSAPPKPSKKARKPAAPKAPKLVTAPPVHAPDQGSFGTYDDVGMPEVKPEDLPPTAKKAAKRTGTKRKFQAS